ncbi:MAG TPA: hypothetical protein ENK32_11300, partial [Anaerolineae bacterium]|nr:hypothetical protein [Anaerolineae bacterium]
MEEIQRLQSPDASFPPATQWTNRTPILFPWTNMVLYGMGLLAGLAAWFGFFWALGRIFQGKPDWVSHAIPAAWSGMYFLFMGTRWVKSIRYFLPIYPTLLLLGAWALFALWDRARARDKAGRQKFRQILAGGLITAVVLFTFAWAWTFLDTYKNPVTRVAASAWMYENIPSGATLIYEADGVEKEYNLPLKEYGFVSGSPLTLGFPMPEDGVITAVRLNYLQTADGSDNQPVTFAAGYTDGNNVATAVTLNNQREAVTLDVPDQAAAKDSFQQILIELTEGNAPVLAGTSLLMNEHWDDLIPVSLDGRSAFGSYYTEVQNSQRPVTNPDSPEKRQELADWLDEADYVVLSSQRALWSLPRIPLTYPLMIRYYEALFSGELGFDLVYQNQKDYRIGPLRISDVGGKVRWGAQPEVGWPPPGDLAVEEAFSVYDHPPVWIFAKTDAYSRENTLNILDDVDLSQTAFMTPGEATRAPNGLMMPAATAALQQAGGTFRDLFNVNGVLSNNWMLAAVVWWLALTLLGWLAFPLAFVIFRGLPDKGYALSRMLAIFLVAYFVWLSGSLRVLPNTAVTAGLGVLLLGITSIIIAAKNREDLANWRQAHTRYMLFVELFALGLFILAILIRLGNPDVWDVIWGGEKPMDLTYFTAVLKSTVFPPYDPWFAGGYLNYYYYGFVLAGVLPKLLGIVPALAYNLNLATFYALTGL